jgi:hypothetical protein
VNGFAKVREIKISLAESISHEVRDIFYRLPTWTAKYLVILNHPSGKLFIIARPYAILHANPLISRIAYFVFKGYTIA